jgi:hypothetical protein
MPEPPATADQNSNGSIRAGWFQVTVCAISTAATCVLFWMCFASFFRLTVVNIVRDRQLWMLELDRGMLAVTHLAPWTNSPPEKPVLIVNRPIPFSKMAPWKWAWRSTDPSWWEGVGYQTEKRRRVLGFERASGIFWPPFVTQHRKVPFVLYSIPLWLLLPAFAFIPVRMVAVEVRGRLRRRREARLSEVTSR